MNGLLARRKKMPSSVVGESLGNSGFDAGAIKIVWRRPLFHLTVISSKINIERL